MPIYTKKGDRGETGLPGGRRLSKTDLVFEFLGSLDQTSATIGQALSFIDSKNDLGFIEVFRKIQSNFLSIGAYTAAEEAKKPKLPLGLQDETLRLENLIDEWDKQLPQLTNFILVGGTQTGATLHLARTTIRQAERSYHRLEIEQRDPAISEYLNRLSDFFFQAARYYNYCNHQPESPWHFS